jgi:hypothetical protein
MGIYDVGGEGSSGEWLVVWSEDLPLAAKKNYAVPHNRKGGHPIRVNSRYNKGQFGCRVK